MFRNTATVEQYSVSVAVLREVINACTVDLVLNHSACLVQRELSEQDVLLVCPVKEACWCSAHSFVTMTIFSFYWKPLVIAGGSPSFVQGIVSRSLEKVCMTLVLKLFHAMVPQMNTVCIRLLNPSEKMALLCQEHKAQDTF